MTRMNRSSIEISFLHIYIMNLYVKSFKIIHEQISPTVITVPRSRFEDAAQKQAETSGYHPTITGLLS